MNKVLADRIQRTRGMLEAFFAAYADFAEGMTGHNCFRGDELANRADAVLEDALEEIGKPTVVLHRLSADSEGWMAEIDGTDRTDTTFEDDEPEEVGTIPGVPRDAASTYGICAYCGQPGARTWLYVPCRATTARYCADCLRTGMDLLIRKAEGAHD